MTITQAQVISINNNQCSDDPLFMYKQNLFHFIAFISMQTQAHFSDLFLIDILSL